MKKFLKVVLLIPIFLITMLTVFACNDDGLKSISLSLPNYENVGGYYMVKMTDKSITIKTETDPDTYKAEDLTWQSDATNIVTVYKNTFKTKGIGQAVITASYKNKDGKNVKASLKIKVQPSSEEMSFNKDKYETVYTGEELKDNYTIIQDDGSGKYEYLYYNITEESYVDSIVNVGTYQITCRKVLNNEEACSTILFVNKATLSLTSSDYEITYAEELPEGLYNKNAIPSDLIDNGDIGAYLYGIGKDSETKIGKFIPITEATNTSNAGEYDTSIHFELYDEYLKNYSTTANVTYGSLSIQKKKVVLVIRDQNISYGEVITPNNFNLYSYEDYVEEGNSLASLTPITHDYIDFSQGIYLGNPSYKVENQPATTNSVGQLDVLFNEDDSLAYYDLCYDQATTTGSNNLNIMVKINGKLTIAPRNVKILPKANQTKVYGEVDPEKLTYNVIEGSFINKDTINDFLYVDYKSNTLGDGNYRADCSRYFYSVNNTLNDNYNITLDERADETNEDLPIEQKTLFEVIPCQINIELNTVNEKYKKLPAGATLHTLSYYSLLEDGSTPHYTTTIKSLKINNEDILSNTAGQAGTYCKSADYNESGEILLKTGGKFKFSLLLSTIANENYFLSYNVDLSDVYYDGADGETNFRVNFTKSNLNLSKIKLTIVPNLTYAKVNKVYDATANVDETLGADYYVLGDLEPDTYITDILSDTSYNKVIVVKNIKVNDDGSQTVVSGPKDVGRYVLGMTTTLVYQTGKEYYDVTFDDSQPYYYNVLKCGITIKPDAGHTKVYASNDPEFTYTMYGLPEDEDDDIEMAGVLSREPGENVGEYKITLGTLDLGPNYELSMYATPEYLEITQRTVDVEPISYITTYGDSYPSVIGYEINVVGEYNPALLVAPTFSGKLALDGTKVGLYYPVKFDEDGDVTYYDIIQGTLECTSSNYVVNFIDTSTFTINKRETIVDIVSQQKESKDGLELSVTLDSAFYTASNLLEGTKTQLSLTLKDNDSFYNVNTFTLTLTEGVNDVSSCYDVKIGKDVVYNINIQIIYLAIVDKETKLTPIVNQTYTGYEVADKFALVCQTEGYEISADSDFDFVFASGDTPVATPINVGSYVTSIDISQEGKKIIITNNKHTCDANCEPNCANKNIEFTSLDEGVIKNTVLSISNYGYLNIKKANITYDQTKLGFVSDLSYGSNTLSNIKTTYKDGGGADVPIFNGVGPDTIVLKTYDSGLNFTYTSENYSLSTYEANRSYSINLTVEATKGGVIDANYNSLNINVPLYVAPKNMIVNTATFTVNANVAIGGAVTYDGQTKPLSLSLQMTDPNDSDKYATTYSYLRLKVQYSQSTKAMFEYYDYDTVNGIPKVQPEVKTQSYASSSLRNITSLFTIEYQGVNYLIVNNVYSLLLETNESSVPVNAGIYACIATCESQSNYIFATGTVAAPTVVGTNVSYAFIYEIDKTNVVAIENWKDSFYYTTEFNLTNKSSLPFEYEMTPNFKDSVVYSMREPAEWPVNNILNVGTYSVNIMFENENYYFSKDMEFKVEKLSAEIIFPTLKTYVYIGEGRQITSFLNNIRIALKDKDGNTTNSFYYNYEGDLTSDPLLNFEFYEPDSKNPITDPTKLPPWQVTPDGKYYKLKVIYGGESTNYYGEGIYEYAIIKKAYMGSVKFQNATITYDPTYTPESLYNLIYTKMFTIGLEEGYNVKIYHQDNADEWLDPNEEADKPEESWMYNLLRIGQTTLRVEVEFEDGITAKYSSTAVLTINKAVISQNSIDTTKTGASFVYNGYNMYNYLIFNTVSLNPDKFEEEVEDDGFIYYVKKTETKKIDEASGREKICVTMTVRDNFTNKIFDLTYTYQRYVAGDFAYQYMNTVPLDPNEDGEKYKVIYEFNFESHYTSTITLTTKEYTIKKVDVLYISADDWTVTYSGNNYSTSYIQPASIKVRNNSYEENTNMKVDLVTNSFDIYEYKNTKGVCLFAYFTSDTNNLTKTIEVINAKEYRVNISLLYKPGYDLTKYFKAIKFGSEEPIDIASFISAGASTNGYNCKLTQLFTVEKVEYNTYNWTEAIYVTGNTLDEDGNNVLSVDSKITGFGSGVISVTIYKRDSGSNTEPHIVKINNGSDYDFAAHIDDYLLSTETGYNEYTFVLECDENHIASDIIFIIMAPEPEPEPEPEPTE